MWMATPRLAFVLALLLLLPVTAVADRIAIWRPLDVEEMRQVYANRGVEFPEARFREIDRQRREWLEEASRQLAPVKPNNDNRLHTYRFEGRILRVIPAVNPSAPQTSSDYYPKIVFQAYGEGGAPVSRRPAIISTQRILDSAIDNQIDTLADYTLLLSNRHELMGVDFGSERHRQAIFQALDPDGSMGLPGGGEKQENKGLKEGALMLFGEHGAEHAPQNPSEMMRFLQRRITDPLNPLHQFPADAEVSMIGEKQFRLTYALLEEYARSLIYPGYEPGYTKTAQAALQTLYTLSLAAPDLTSPAYKERAVRFHAIGESMYVALSNILGYRVNDGGWEYAPIEKSLLPLRGQDLRRAALELLADGPVVPLPEISDHTGAPLLQSLLTVIEKDQGLAPLARRILERQLAPEAGEAAEVTALYELDREQNRKSLWSRFLWSPYDTDPYVLPAAQALAHVGWGKEEEIREIVAGLVKDATRTIHGSEEFHPINRRAYEVLRLIARPDEYTRKDRMDYAMVAVEELERQIAKVRETNNNGFGSRISIGFIERWDADNK